MSFGAGFWQIRWKNGVQGCMEAEKYSGWRFARNPNASHTRTGRKFPQKQAGCGISSDTVLSAAPTQEASDDKRWQSSKLGQLCSHAKAGFLAPRTDKGRVRRFKTILFLFPFKAGGFCLAGAYLSGCTLILAAIFVRFGSQWLKASYIRIIAYSCRQLY